MDDVYVKYCGQQVKGSVKLRAKDGTCNHEHHFSYICNVLEVGINFDSMNACKATLPKCG